MKALLICFYFFLFLFILLPQSFAESSIIINEFFAHPSSGNKEWVEFYNPDHIDLSGYFLDDDTDFGSDTGNSSKKNLATINNDNPLFSYFEMSSFLNNSGDYVVLFSPAGEIVDKYQYTKDPGVDVSIGRFPDGTGEMAVLSNPTKGQPNSSPHIDTPTPSPLPNPTSTLKPTKPTSTKSSTKAPVTPAPTQKISSPVPSSGQVLSTAISPKINIPTSILGQSTKSAIATSSSKVNNTKKEVKVLGNNQNNIFKILIGVGGIFIIACAILLFRYFKNKEVNNE